MPILTINDRESTLFFDGLKKQAWAEVRNRLGIPRSVKLGVNNVSDDEHYRKLYLKGSSPRQYLLANTFGAFGAQYSTLVSGAASPALGAPATPAPTQATPPATNGRFAVANNSERAWKQMTRDEFLAQVRETPELADDATLPEGFPKDAGDDAIVLDPVTGTLYFRA